MSLVRFTDTSSTEIYTYLHTLSLHDALPIFAVLAAQDPQRRAGRHLDWRRHGDRVEAGRRRPDGLGPVRDGAGLHRRDPGDRAGQQARPRATRGTAGAAPASACLAARIRLLM